MPSLKELTKREVRIVGGHRMCPGCPAPLIVKQVLYGSKDPVVMSNATGCLEVATTIYPYTSWDINWMHSAFENAAATISGVEAAYNALKRRKKLGEDVRINFVAFGGDGGTYDIGLQALSGALERGHRFVYVCYNNEAYMNTGIQRSSATPIGAHTTTSPAGRESYGKKQKRKDLTMIAAAHHIPYAAQVSPAFYMDTIKKAEKAFNANGPTFINAISPCVPGWKYPADKTLDYAKKAVDTCFWPLYEIENGVLKITYKPKNKLPIQEFLKGQGRFRHLFAKKRDDIIEFIQKDIDQDWERLLKLDGMKLF